MKSSPSFTTFSNESRFREPILMQKRTGELVGPGSYKNDRFNSIFSNVNASHHTAAKPTLGRPFPKDNTCHGFENLVIYDNTFSTIANKRAARQVEREAGVVAEQTLAIANAKESRKNKKTIGD